MAYGQTDHSAQQKIVRLISWRLRRFRTPTSSISVMPTVHQKQAASARWVALTDAGAALSNWLTLHVVPAWETLVRGFERTGDLRCKSTVCGLNGHRLYYIISLFEVTYKSTIQVSRTFHALFTRTLENSDTCD